MPRGLFLDMGMRMNWIWMGWRRVDMAQAVGGMPYSLLLCRRMRKNTKRVYYSSRTISGATTRRAQTAATVNSTEGMTLWRKMRI